MIILGGRNGATKVDGEFVFEMSNVYRSGINIFYRVRTCIRRCSNVFVGYRRMDWRTVTRVTLLPSLLVAAKSVQATIIIAKRETKYGKYDKIKQSSTY
jgi:hypothetical protein